MQSSLRRSCAGAAFGLMLVVLAHAVQAQAGQDWTWLSATHVTSNDPVSVFIDTGERPFAYPFESYQLFRGDHTIHIFARPSFTPFPPGVEPQDLEIPLGPLSPGRWTINVVLAIDTLPPARQLPLQVDQAAVSVPATGVAATAALLCLVLAFAARALRRARG